METVECLAIPWTEYFDGKLTLDVRNPNEKLIYINISDCSPDEIQSLINTMRVHLKIQDLGKAPNLSDERMLPTVP